MRFVLLVALALAAPAAARPRATETIRYEAGACLGPCPSYVVVVSSDGRGLFEGRGNTAVHGRRAFAVTRAQFAAFRAALRPVRPTGEVLIEPGRPLCGAAATDQPSADVRWSGAAGDPRHLAFYFGCDIGRHRDLERAIAAAPRALPIAAFIGPQG